VALTSRKNSKPIGLEELSKDLVGTVRPPSLREKIASRVLTLFTVSLMATLGLVAALSVMDIVMIWNHVITPEERLVTQPVLMSMIGATIVELGAALTTIVLTVFKAPRKPPDEDDPLSG